MKVDIKSLPGKSQVEVKIEVPKENFTPFIEKAARKLSKDTTIKGFRPGKAPVKMVAEHVGHERLLKEAMDMALPQFFVDAVIENNVEAINRPSITIEELAMDAPFRFTAIVDVLPKVELGDPKKLKIEKRTPEEVKEEQIDKELAYLAKMRSTTLEVARPAQEGDVVMTDFAVSVNGAVIEGGESKNHPIVIGEGHFVPGFEDKIKGIQAGDSRQFSIEFPSDFANENLREKKAEVSVKAHSVHKRSVPEINDEFAKGMGKFENLQQLKDELRNNMKAELEQKEKERHLGELAQKYAEISTFGVIPEVLINKEIDHRLHELSNMLGYQQKTIDDYLTSQKKSLEQLRADLKESAEKQVKVGLTLRRLAEKENITVDEKEIAEEAAKQLQQFKNPKEAEKHIDVQELRDHIESVLRNRKTLERLAEIVSK